MTPVTKSPLGVNSSSSTGVLSNCSRWKNRFVSSPLKRLDSRTSMEYGRTPCSRPRFLSVSDMFDRLHRDSNAEHNGETETRGEDHDIPICPLSCNNVFSVIIYYVLLQNVWLQALGMLWEIAPERISFTCIYKTQHWHMASHRGKGTKVLSFMSWRASRVWSSKKRHEFHYTVFHTRICIKEPSDILSWLQPWLVNFEEKISVELLPSLKWRLA